MRHQPTDEVTAEAAGGLAVARAAAVIIGMGAAAAAAAAMSVKCYNINNLCAAVVLR